MRRAILPAPTPPFRVPTPPFEMEKVAVFGINGHGQDSERMGPVLAQKQRASGR